MKSLDIARNYNLSSIAFSNSFPIVLSRMIGQKAFGES